MKICIVAHNLPAYYSDDPAWKYGGAEVQTAFIANALAGAGHDITLVVANLTDESSLPHRAINAFNDRDGIPGARFFSRAAGLWRALSKAGADLYFQRNAGMVTGVVGTFCRRHGKPFVYGAASNTDFATDPVGVNSARDRFLFRRGLRRASGFVVQNETQRDTCKQTMGKPVAMIPNGVEPPLQGDDTENGRVLWAGGLRPVKRPEIFIELARRLPDIDFTLVGGGPDAYQDFAAEMTASAGQLSNVKVTGWIPQSDVIRELRQSALLVNTSSIEGFPNVYLEAWNHGIPVVTFVDVDNLIADHKLGAICHDIDDMERAVRSLMGDAGERREIGNRARTIVEERYSAAALAPSYDTFLRHIADAVSAG